MCLCQIKHNTSLLNNMNNNVIIIAITTTTLSKMYSPYYMSYSKCIHHLPHGNVTALYEVTTFSHLILEGPVTQRDPKSHVHATMLPGVS